MRFFVLLQKVSIEELLPVFSELADDDADTVEKLTDTYELLRNTEPEIGDGILRVGTFDADGDSWARNLGKHIAFQAGEPDDLAIIAGNLIFDCTFRVLE